MLPLVGLWAQLRQLEKAFVNKALLAAAGKSSDSEQTKVSSHSTLHPRAVSTQRALHLLQKYLPNSMYASATQTLDVNYLLGPVQCYIFTHKCPDSLGVAPCDPFHTKTRKLRQSLHSDWHKPRVKSDKGRTIFSALLSLGSSALGPHIPCLTDLPSAHTQKPNSRLAPRTECLGAEWLASHRHL